MNARLEPKNPLSDVEPESDATDGGWDPYVTGLLQGRNADASLATGDDEDATPVMSFSRRPSAGNR
jgi:hypothetical protein